MPQTRRPLRWPDPKEVLERALVFLGQSEKRSEKSLTAAKSGLRAFVRGALKGRFVNQTMDISPG
jgi:hypothetical protein